MNNSLKSFCFNLNLILKNLFKMGTIINQDSSAVEKEIEKDEIKDIDKTLYLIK